MHLSSRTELRLVRCKLGTSKSDTKRPTISSSHKLSRVTDPFEDCPDSPLPSSFPRTHLRSQRWLGHPRRTHVWQAWARVPLMCLLWLIQLNMASLTLPQVPQRSIPRRPVPIASPCSPNLPDTTEDLLALMERGPTLPMPSDGPHISTHSPPPASPTPTPPTLGDGPDRPTHSPPPASPTITPPTLGDSPDGPAHSPPPTSPTPEMLTDVSALLSSLDQPDDSPTPQLPLGPPLDDTVDIDTLWSVVSRRCTETAANVTSLYKAFDSAKKQLLDAQLRQAKGNPPSHLSYQPKPAGCYTLDVPFLEMVALTNKWVVTLWCETKEDELPEVRAKLSLVTQDQFNKRSVYTRNYKPWQSYRSELVLSKRQVDRRSAVTVKGSFG